VILICLLKFRNSASCSALVSPFSYTLVINHLIFIFFPFLFILFNFFSPGYLQWFTVSTLRLRPHVFKRPRVPYFTKSRARHMRILNAVRGGKSEMRYSKFIFIAAGCKLFEIRIVLYEFFFTHDNIIHKYI